MGMTLTEKLLAKKSGNQSVFPSQIVTVEIDRLMINDFIGPTVLHEFGSLQDCMVKFPDRILVSADHTAPPTTVKEANNLVRIREFCRFHGINRFAEIGRHGISHQMMLEDFTLPGEIAVGTDSHSTMYGSVGALGCGITASDAAMILATGELWLQVPETIRIGLTGKLPKGTTAKDVALSLLPLLPADLAGNKALEVGGPGLSQISIEGRMAIANMLAETDAKNVIFEADKMTCDYLGLPDEYIQRPDDSAEYNKIIELDLSGLEPVLACPHRMDNIHTVKEMEGKRVDQVFIGSCANGRMEDLKQAAEILAGKKVCNDTRLIVVPASQIIMEQAIEEGIISELLEAGAAVLTPGCASCAGFGQGLLGDGEVCVSTTNRNFKGRMGSRESEVFLASAYTAAMAALHGYIKSTTN